MAVTFHCVCDNCKKQITVSSLSLVPESSFIVHFKNLSRYACSNTCRIALIEANEWDYVKPEANVTVGVAPCLTSKAQDRMRVDGYQISNTIVESPKSIAKPDESWRFGGRNKFMDLTIAPLALPKKKHENRLLLDIEAGNLGFKPAIIMDTVIDSGKGGAVNLKFDQAWFPFTVNEANKFSEQQKALINSESNKLKIKVLKSRNASADYIGPDDKAYLATYAISNPKGSFNLVNGSITEPKGVPGLNLSVDENCFFEFLGYKVAYKHKELLLSFIKAYPDERENILWFVSNDYQLEAKNKGIKPPNYALDEHANKFEECLPLADNSCIHNLYLVNRLGFMPVWARPFIPVNLNTRVGKTITKVELKNDKSCNYQDLLNAGQDMEFKAEKQAEGCVVVVPNPDYKATINQSDTQHQYKGWNIPEKFRRVLFGYINRYQDVDSILWFISKTYRANAIDRGMKAPEFYVGNYGTKYKKCTFDTLGAGKCWLLDPKGEECVDYAVEYCDNRVVNPVPGADND